MRCPKCPGALDKLRGPNTSIVLIKCSSCGYSRAARIDVVLSFLLKDYAENVGVDPKTILDNPTNPQELQECLTKLLKSQGLSSLR